MSRKNFLIAYRTFFALLGFSAIVTEIATLVERGYFNPSNFFSFFTIESNTFAVAVFLLSAFAVTGSRKGRLVEILRGASTLYMVTVLIVFDVLLANLDASLLTAVPWDNTVLHYIIPFAALVDWVMDPPKQRIAFKSTLIWLVFPLLYVAYSLVRGSYVGWYPYPFLDPATHGYGGVAIVSVGIVVLVLVLAWLLTRLPMRKRNRKAV